MMRGAPERLRDILDSIDCIEKYVSRGFDAYSADELIQVWIVHHIQIIGEAAANLPPEIRDQYPEVPWSDMAAMRNKRFSHYWMVQIHPDQRPCRIGRQAASRPPPVYFKSENMPHISKWT